MRSIAIKLAQQDKQYISIREVTFSTNDGDETLLEQHSQKTVKMFKKGHKKTGANIQSHEPAPKKDKNIEIFDKTFQFD